MLDQPQDLVRLTTLVSQPGLVVQKAERRLPRGIAFTFNAFGQPIKPGHGFGGEPLLRLGFDIVAFQSQDNAWWQNVSDDQLEKIAETAARDVDGAPYALRFSYGSSMGGYGAILFADRLKLDKAITISPQYDIRATHDRRWSEQARSIRFVHEIDRTDLSACRVYIYYDPHDTDGWHASQIARRAPDCVLIKLPYAGHPAGPFLVQIGMLAPVLESIIVENIDPRSVFNRTALRARRHQSAQYFWTLSHRALGGKRYALALDLIDRAIALQPAAPDLHIQRSLALEQLGQLDRAIESVRAAMELLADKTYAQERLAYLIAARDSR